MQQPQMIVLGLIAQGARYGFEMEQRIDRSKMRLWARIGKSTIYKALRDLLKAGDLTEKREPAERGPGKAVYSLTESGQETLVGLVRQALGSRESVYSDRIAGLVFSCSISEEIAEEEIKKSIRGMADALEMIDVERTANEDYPVAKVVLDFYRKVYTAEREAMIEIRDLIAK